MVNVRIYSELSFRVDMDLKGVDYRTRDYDVQQHRKEIYNYLRKKLSAAFSEAQNVGLHYFEFSLASEDARAD